MRIASMAVAVVFLTAVEAVIADEWMLKAPVTPFLYDGQYVQMSYEPLDSAELPWQLCVSFPHLKDAYWLNVNFGMVEHARRLGIGMQLFEAGGYLNVKRQIAQINRCMRDEPSALVVGTVSFDRLNETITQAAKRVPVLATVNDIEDVGISAKSGVSWYSMGKKVGDYLAERHPYESPTTRVAWFPGPEAAGWVPFVHQGFLDGIKGSSIELTVTLWGDTGKAIQRALVEEVMETLTPVDYLVGNALAAEAAISVVRERKLEQEVSIVATYLTHGVFRGIKRQRILAAPTDFPVLQGRLSVDQAVRILEKREYTKHAGPDIVMVHSGNLDALDLTQALAPPSFLPTFRVGSDGEN